MSESGFEEQPRIVVTPGDVARVAAPGSSVAAPVKSPIPWWARVVACLLAVVFPLLCLFAIGIRVANRQRERRVREAWNSLLCTLLIASGLATFVAAAWLWSVRMLPGSNQSVRLEVTGLDDLDAATSLPSFPVTAPMTPVEIAARTKALVFIVTDEQGAANLDFAPVGAAMLLMANATGYLLGTNRHVADETGLFGLSGGKNTHVVVFSEDRRSARAEVIARHRRLDLALLWVKRRSGTARFRQPIVEYSLIAVGSPVFVVGHPQRLFFTLSNGLVSRLDGSEMLQITAPISPGNSGGPVYDAQGNLLGVVTLKVDRMLNPNAENLNFATRADAFLDQRGWDFSGQAGTLLQGFVHGNY